MIKHCLKCQYDNLEFESFEVSEQDILFFESEELTHVYQIQEGYVKMVKYLENGDERIIGIMVPGDFIALLAVLQNKKTYLATAVPLSKIIVKKIRKEEVFRKYQSSDLFRDRCLTCAVTRSNTFHNHLVNSANSDIKEKVVNSLKLLYEKFGRVEDEKQVLDLPFSKTVLANFIGIRRETLSRTITKLIDEQIIYNEKNSYILNYVI
jgi:CRP/FNR family transcriptional regulator